MTGISSLLFLFACGYDEGLLIENLRGKVVVPREAATREMFNAEGDLEVITDPRLIGPVYLGLFPSVREGLYEYPHPEIGPAFRPGQPGDTYPYGGTTIGDFRFACMEALACRSTSGRFVDFDAVVEWFNVRLQDPLTTVDGQLVTSGDYIRQVCYQTMNYTSDDEIRLTATDRNGDGTIDPKDLDFVEREDGDFEAEFTIWQQEFPISREGVGPTLWGWMDAPSEDGFRFSTCDPNNGFQYVEYDQTFFGGRQYRELLNSPAQFISTGDWVSDVPHVYSEIDDAVELRLGFEVQN